MKGAKTDQNWRTRHIDEILGPRVEQLHNERGFSRADVARLLGISDATLQNVEEGTARMTASQLWQICGATGVEIADVFAGLPTHICRTKADYDRLQDRKRYATANSGEQDGTRSAGRSSGVGEQFWDSEIVATLRHDLAALAKAVRDLSPEDVAFLIRATKGLKI